MLSFTHIHHRYQSNSPWVLADLTWQVADKQTALITGQSGSGKSTLLHIAAGLLQPTQGDVEYDGVKLYQLKLKARDQWRAKNIGIVLQNFHLLPALTVLENMLLAQTLSGKPANKTQILEDLSYVGLENHAHKKPHQLSQGQRQRVAIVRAIAHRPRWLFADEPTASLDAQNAEKMIHLLHHITHQVGASLIVVSHDERINHYFEHHLHLTDTIKHSAVQAS